MSIASNARIQLGATMTRRHTSTAAALLALVAAGAAAALILASSAAAWDWTNLPNGYRVIDVQLGNNCHELTLNGTDIGNTCNAGFQAALDAYIDSTICTVNPAAGGSACVTTTTASATTPAAPPAPTSSTPTTTSASTDPAPPTTTDPAPPATDTTTTTVATTTSTDDQIAQLTARITALEQQIAALSARVDRIALAGDASWLAFEKAVAGGTDIPTAADIARGTYLNAEYGLGQFAP